MNGNTTQNIPKRNYQENRHQDNLIYGTLKRIKGNCAGMF